MNQQTEPTYTLNLPQSVAMMCVQIMRKLPLEQVEQPYSILTQEIERAETERQTAERAKIVADAAKSGQAGGPPIPFPLTPGS